MCNQVSSPMRWVAMPCLPLEGLSRTIYSWLEAWAPMRKYASVLDIWMKSRARFPCRVCISQLNRKISSVWAAVSPDVTMKGPTHTSVSCPRPWAVQCITLDGGASAGTVTPVPKPWLAGADPILGTADEMPPEPRMG